MRHVVHLLRNLVLQFCITFVNPSLRFCHFSFSYYPLCPMFSLLQCLSYAVISSFIQFFIHVPGFRASVILTFTLSPSLSSPVMPVLILSISLIQALSSFHRFFFFFYLDIPRKENQATSQTGDILLPVCFFSYETE